MVVDDRAGIALAPGMIDGNGVKMERETQGQDGEA